MNKNELINELSEETTFSKKDVTRVVDSFTRIIGRTLKKGEKVSITGFGSFWLSRRAARKGINPTNLQRIDWSFRKNGNSIAGKLLVSSRFLFQSSCIDIINGNH